MRTRGAHRTHNLCETRATFPVTVPSRVERRVDDRQRAPVTLEACSKERAEVAHRRRVRLDLGGLDPDEQQSQRGKLRRQRDEGLAAVFGIVVLTLFGASLHVFFVWLAGIALATGVYILMINPRSVLRLRHSSSGAAGSRSGCRHLHCGNAKGYYSAMSGVFITP